MHGDPPECEPGKRSSLTYRVGCFDCDVPVMPYRVHQLGLLGPEEPSEFVVNPPGRVTQIRIGFGEQLLDGELERGPCESHVSPLTTLNCRCMAGSSLARCSSVNPISSMTEDMNCTISSLSCSRS